MGYYWNSKMVFENCDHFPSSFRMLICGPSGVGKTALLIKLLTSHCDLHNQRYLDYEKLVIITPSISQAEYQILIQGLKAGLFPDQIANLFENQLSGDYKQVIERLASYTSEHSKIEVETFTDPTLIPPPERLNPNKKKCLVVTDDCMLKNVSAVSTIFVYGRPLNINSIFITQAFFQVPNRAIRENCNFFILFKMNAKVKEKVYQHIIGADFDTYEDFDKLCKSVWDDRHSFMSINCDKHEYTKNLNEFIQLNQNMASGISLDQYHKNLLARDKSDKVLRNQVKEYRTQSQSLFQQKSEEQKPTTTKISAITEALNLEDETGKKIPASKILAKLSKKLSKLPSKEALERLLENKLDQDQFEAIREAVEEIRKEKGPAREIDDIWGPSLDFTDEVESQREEIINNFIKDSIVDPFTLNRAHGSPAEPDQIAPGQFRFNLSQRLEKTDYAIAFKIRNCMLVVRSEQEPPPQFPISNELLELLFTDMKTSMDSNINKLYKSIVQACELKNIEFLFEFDKVYQETQNLQNKKWTRSKAATREQFDEMQLKKIQEKKSLLIEKGRGYDTEKLVEIVQDVKKSVKLKLVKALITLVSPITYGVGYHLEKYGSTPVVIPPSSDEQMKRVLVLLGSLNSGNNAEQILPETTALLDELLKSNTIDKKQYKRMYWRIRHKLLENK